MDLILFFKGMAVGFAIAAPVGPVGIYCVQRTLETGLIAGLAAGVGAAVADTVFGVLAAFGLTFVTHILLSYQAPLRLVGGVLMLAIGIDTLWRRPRARPRSDGAHTLVGDGVSMFTLTITNPITLLAFAPVFVAVEAVVPEGDLLAAWMLIVGVLAGSALWWLVLCSGASLFRARLREDRMRWIYRVSGGAIILFGLLVVLSLTGLGERIIG